MKRLNNIAAPGVAEQILAEGGFELVERGARVSMIEWPSNTVGTAEALTDSRTISTS